MGKNRLWKKLLVYLMTFMMVFSSLPTSVFAAGEKGADGIPRSNEDQIGYHHDVNQKEGDSNVGQPLDSNLGLDRFVRDKDGEILYENGKPISNTWETDITASGKQNTDDWRVRVDKTIEPEGHENQFNVTLTVETKDSIIEHQVYNDSAVVLVIDASSSMTMYDFDDIDGDGKKEDRLAAAKYAANMFVDQYSSISGGKRMVSVVYFFKDSVMTVDWTDLHKDNGEIDNAKVASVKSSINAIDDDGGTNIQCGLLSAIDLLKKDAVKDLDVKSAILLSDGAPSSYAKNGLEVPNGSMNYSGVERDHSCTSHEKSTAAATYLKTNTEADLYSVFCGSLSEELFCDCEKTTDYLTSISDIMVPATETETLLGAFDSFYEEILSKTQAWQGTDPMGTTGVLVKVNSDDKDSYVSTSSNLTWMLLNADYDEAYHEKTGIYRYEITYQVGLNTLQKDFNYNHYYATNAPTELKYYFETKDGVEGTEGMKSIWFNIPTVRGTEGGYYELVKVDESGNALDKKAEFTISHTCKTCDICGLTPCLNCDDDDKNNQGTGCMAAWSDKAISGEATKEDGTKLGAGYVSFHDIPSGHSFILEETAAPNGYAKSEDKYKLTVSYGQVTVHKLNENGTVGEEVKGQLAVVNEELPIMDVSGEKIWVDNNDADDIRPNSITVSLYGTVEINGVTNYVINSDGDLSRTKQRYGYKTVNSANNWSWNWQSVPKEIDDNPVTWYVEENAVSGYETIYDGFDIVNIHTPEAEGDKTVYIGQKNWVGGPADDLSVDLYIKGTDTKAEYESFEWIDKEGDNWIFQFNDIDKFDENGEPIQYEVKEVVPDGYTPNSEVVDPEGKKEISTSLQFESSYGDKEFSVSGENIGIVVAKEKGTNKYQVWSSQSLSGKESEIIELFSSNDKYAELNSQNTTFSTGDKTYSIGTGNKRVSVTIDYSYSRREVTIDFNNNYNNSSKLWDNFYYGTIAFNEEYTPGTTILTNTKNTATATAFENATVVKVDADNSQVTLEGAEFALYDNADCAGAAINEYTSGSDGKIIISAEDIPEDYRPAVGKTTTLYMKETSAPTGYEAPETVYSVTISAQKSDNVFNSTDNAYVTTTTYTVKINGEVRVEVENAGILTEATVKKVWDDDNNQDGNRPSELKVTLSNGTEVTLNEANDWTATVTDLPKYANGEEIAYTWTEETLPEGYTLTNTVVNGTVTTLTNSYTPEVTEATVVKVWNDAENQDGKRPTSLTVTLKKGNDTVETVTLNKDNNWTATVTGLPKYANGNEIVYTWTEGEMPKGYTLTDTAVNGTVTTLTNSYTPEETEATVLKVWDDDSNRDNKRPKELKVTLSDGTEVTLNEENKWTATVTGLPKYADGKEIVYTWTEDEADLPEGYTLSSVNREGTLTTLTNSYTPERTSATVTKAWNDNNNQDGKRPEEISVNLLANGVGIDKTFILNEANNWTVTVNDLLKYAGGKEIKYTWTESSVLKPYELESVAKNGIITTITNSYTPETTEATVKKVWEDSRNQDGKRPAEIKVTLSNGTEVTLNEANKWTATVEGLPKYADGVEIVYTWTEDETGLPEGYELTDASVNGTVTTLTNEYDTEETSATIKKVWDDAENQDGKRPESLKVTLSNGTEVTLNENNGWEATVTGLPKYADGEEIEYTWTEDETGLPEGYELTSTSVNGTITTLTNSYIPETTEATVLKVWDDAENQDGKRPAELKVTLSNGTELTLNEANKWTATVKDLPKYAEGKEIKYTWTEDESGLPEGYELTDTDVNGTFTTLTNSYEPKTTEATVKKVWEDSRNQDGKRPETLTVTLNNGTKDVQTVTLSEENKWKATVEGLPKYANGVEIEYKWTEGEMPKGYTLTDSKVDGTVTTLTNSYSTEKTAATVRKVWDDDENRDGKRPAEIIVTLSNGQEVALNTGNNWEATVTDLPKYANGVEIVYTWTENETGLPEGYELTKTEVNGTVTTFTNSYEPATTEATVKKSWDDDENRDGKRPGELKVTLSDGTEVTLNEANNWTATVEDLPKFANGVEIVYTWTEGEMPDGYMLTDTEVDGTVTTLTNSYTPEVTEATIKKVWDDASNQDGKRPSELKVTLSDGTEVTLNEANNWTATVENLPKYADGNEIVYTWTEGSMPDGYTLTDTAVNGTVTTLTNSYTPDTTEATVKKSWDDADNQDGKRPKTLTVTLSNGTKDVETVTLSEENKWTATVEGLPKYAGGVKINYTWTEGEMPEGYTLTDSKVDGTVTTLTNSYDTEKTAATIRKVWDDAENQDGKRPGELKVTLSNGTEVTLNEGNEWTATVENLPKYANGREIKYTWTEGSMPDGYTLTDTAVNGTVTTLTNSYIPKTTEVSVIKVWDDAENQDRKRPAELKVTLSNGTEVTLNEANKWTATVKDLPMYANGEEIEYTWTEDESGLPEGYELTKTEVDGTVTTLTNSYEPETTEVTVIKVWDDAENQDRKRPAELKVTLSDGTEVILNANNDWTATVKDLPKYDDGEEIEYTWTEDESGLPEGYELTGTNVNGAVTTLTNSYEPETTEATICKVWNDAENQDGKRPTELKVTLSNGTEVTLNEANKWTATVEDLPKYADGEEIIYTWTEEVEGLPKGYVLTGTSSEGTITTLTNSYKPETTEMTVKKVWHDADNQDGKRPTELRVTLSDGTEVILNANNGWTATVKNLPVYNGGEKIEYSWTEEKLADGYELTDTSVSGTVTTLTNTYEPETTEATVKKAWDDAENQDGKRPLSITATLSNGTKVTLNEANNWTATVEDLPKYANGTEIEYRWTEGEMPKGYELTDASVNGTVTTLTNSYEPETIDVTVKKVWDDANDQDGKRPNNLEVTLSNGTKVTLNERNDWTATVEDLPKFADGVEIIYTWTEGELPKGYALTETSSKGTITTLTNSYKPETREATIKKVWDDANDQDGKRPDELKVTLSDGTEVTLNEANDWTATVTDLPVFEKGKKIEYTWTEDKLPNGYELTDTSVNGTITMLTNSYKPETTEMTVKKVWDDADNQDGIRPASLTVTLNNGTEDVGTVTLSEENKWNGTIEGLPKYKNGGTEIKYTWKEADIEGYELASTSPEGTVTTLTNKHEPEKTEMTVKKVWDDADNQDGIRPPSLTVTLSNGTEVTLNEANGWTATVTNLPKYANGNEIEYSWTEESVEGYELIGADKEGTVTTLTNKHIPEETAATVTKVWDDANNQDGIRPSSITATLKNGTKDVETVTLSEENQWTATVTGLPKYANGEEIEYTWIEESVNGYELTETSAEGTVTTLTNKHIPEETTATVTKVWDDADNQDGKRPPSLTVTLSNGTETVGTVTLNEGNQWTATIENLPKYKAVGEEIKYTWTEGEMPEGYALTETSTDGTVTTLTNSYKPEERAATVTKVWDDADNQDGIRPTSLEVTLNNGTENVGTVTLSEENQWTATIENLPVYKAGEELIYKWTEGEMPEGYELAGTAENGTITLLTNSHVPEVTELTIYKTWKDKNDKYDKRPAEITVYLYADGEIVQTVQITEADKWRYTFADLPKYADGTEIVYTVSEEPVDGYITEIKDMVITNTINPDELDDVVDTGDDSNPWAYGFTALLAMITAAGALFFRRKED